MDGSGQPGQLADVGIRDGVIAWVSGDSSGVALDTIDATDLVVTPGFIDVHSHTPPALRDRANRWNEGVVRQGVTTVVGGPDGGFGPWHIQTLVDSSASFGFGTNVAVYVGHNAISTLR